MMNFRRVFDGVMLAPLCTTNSKLTCETSTPPQTQLIATNAHPHIHTTYTHTQISPQPKHNQAYPISKQKTTLFRLSMLTPQWSNEF